MPQKDKEQTGRERKRDKKGGSKDGIYSSKHIRLLEERTSNQKDKKSSKKSSKK